jgi:hypothetical protein
MDLCLSLTCCTIHNNRGVIVLLAITMIVFHAGVAVTDAGSARDTTCHGVSPSGFVIAA